jgi:hypothetical protein
VIVVVTSCLAFPLFPKIKINRFFIYCKACQTNLHFFGDIEKSLVSSGHLHFFGDVAIAGRYR